MKLNQNKAKKELIVLFQQMADHTLPECKSCLRPLSCCSPEYCDITIEHAKNDWGIELTHTNHPTLPLMGEHGCTAAPHLRPLCSLHTCKINSLGFKPGDTTWTEKYFDIRDKIDNVSAKAF